MTTLLLVEDDPAIYDTIAPYVQREGWELHWARSVAEARRALDGLQPDVALVDRGLPGVAGDVLAPSLRERNIAFFMLTARAQENDRHRPWAGAVCPRIVRSAHPAVWAA